MSEFKDQSITIRLTASQKMALHRKAVQTGQNLTDYLITVIGDYDAQVERADQMEELLRAEESQSQQHRSALDRAQELAQSVTGERLEQARREAVAAYREQVFAGDANGEESETVLALRRRLSEYETPALKALFAEVEGDECDVLENGQPVTVELLDLPDLVRVLAASFTVKRPQ